MPVADMPAIRAFLSNISLAILDFLIANTEIAVVGVPD